MSRAGRIREFINRNLVAIVMIPTIVGIHWGWTKLQDMDVFVTKEEKRDLPILEGARYLEEKIEKKLETWIKKEEVKEE